MSKSRLDRIRENNKAVIQPDLTIEFLFAEIDRLEKESDMMDQTIQGLMQAEHTQSLQLAATNEALKLAKEKMDSEQPSLSEAYVKIGKLSEALRRIEEIASEDMPNSGWGVYSTVNDIHKVARKALGEE